MDLEAFLYISLPAYQLGPPGSTELRRGFSLDGTHVYNVPLSPKSLMNFDKIEGSDDETQRKASHYNNARDVNSICGQVYCEDRHCG